MARNERGSALIVAVIALLVISVIGIGILRFGYREVAGAAALRREQALVSCAEQAQRLLASQFHALGQDPTTLPEFNVSLGNGLTAVGGHYGTTDPAEVQLMQVRSLPLGAFGPAKSARDLTNAIVRGAEAKKPLKVMARCRTAGGAELEMEIGVKFGI